jgi:homoserine O-acetyltransferase
MSYLINELFGTMLLVLLGDGVCMNLNLNKSGQKGGTSTHGGIGWGLAVMVPAFIFGKATGAHFNPSVTIALAVQGSLSWGLVPFYVIGQMIGGFLGDRTPKVAKRQERRYASVVKMVRNGARVIDIGCGDGTLLNVLRTHRNATCSGVEIEIDPFKESLADGNRMYWQDADDGLSFIPDSQYDVAICSDTLQEMKNPRGLLNEALRIADEAIVTFPNFAAYRIRLTLAFTGRLPVSKALPFQWYDTPNIHCITLKDFSRLCEAEGIEILEVKAESRHLIGKILLLLGLKNLGASRIVARLRKKKETV